MPLPWKKNKVNRISQLVAGLQSPKHGGSLVVETGFPTSLIDLVVKNRERFVKTRTKKSLRVQVSDQVRPDAPPPPPPSPTTLLWSNANCLEVGPVVAQMGLTETGSPRPGGKATDYDGGVAVEDQNRLEVFGRGTYRIPLFVAALKILMVVILALSTKKLTFGITTSAFLLLFLEYVGRRFGCYLKRCSEAKKGIKSMGQRVSNFFLLRKFVMLWKRTQICEIETEFAVASCSSVSEIEVLETLEVTETKFEEDVCWEKVSVGDEISLSRLDSERKSFEECEDCVSRNKRKFISKLNSKLIKKFVTKRWRNTKKERKRKAKETLESSSQDEITLGDDKSGKPDEHEEKEEIVVCYYEHHSEENNGTACSNNGLSQAAKEVDVNYDKQRNSGYVILFLIVLAGLLVGRVVALLLVMTWCGVLKFFKRRSTSKRVFL